MKYEIVCEGTKKEVVKPTRITLSKNGDSGVRLSVNGYGILYINSSEGVQFYSPRHGGYMRKTTLHAILPAGWQSK